MTAAADVSLGAVFGRTATLTYRVEPGDSVRAVTGLTSEFQRKADIIGTGRALEVCESPCMDVLAEHIDLHEDWSLGKEARIKQPHATLVGAVLDVHAECIAALGERTDWVVRAYNGDKLVALAEIGFKVKPRATVEARLAEDAARPVVDTATEPPVDAAAAPEDLFCLAECGELGTGFVCVELAGHEDRGIPHGDRDGTTWM